MTKPCSINWPGCASSTRRIAFAWNLSKEAFPSLGAHNSNRFQESIKAAEINLTAHELIKLGALNSINLGYPQDLLNTVRA